MLLPGVNIGESCRWSLLWASVHAIETCIDQFCYGSSHTSSDDGNICETMYDLKMLTCFEMERVMAGTSIVTGVCANIDIQDGKSKLR